MERVDTVYVRFVPKPGVVPFLYITHQGEGAPYVDIFQESLEKKLLKSGADSVRSSNDNATLGYDITFSKSEGRFISVSVKRLSSQDPFQIGNLCTLLNIIEDAFTDVGLTLKRA